MATDGPTTFDIGNCSLTNEDYLRYAVNLAGNRLGIDFDMSDFDPSRFDYISVKKVLGGLSNSLHKVTNTKNGKVVLIRVFGSKTEYLIDRIRERAIYAQLSRCGVSKSIYAFFDGGQVEEWIDGRALSHSELRSGVYNPLIAKNVRKLHTLASSVDIYKILHSNSEPNESSLWPTILKFDKLCKRLFGDPKRTVDPPIDLSYISEKIEIVKGMCSAVNSPVVLCHGDLQPGNIILTSEGDLKFIDFEYSCFMERAYDIANHFMEYSGYECDWSALPNENVRKEFIREYLGDSNPREEDVEAVSLELQPFLLVPNLYWGLWALVQHLYSSIDFDFEGYALKRLTRFIEDTKGLRALG